MQTIFNNINFVRFCGNYFDNGVYVHTKNPVSTSIIIPMNVDTYTEIVLHGKLCKLEMTEKITFG